jgi:cytochrome c peroxidase
VSKRLWRKDLARPSLYRAHMTNRRAAATVVLAVVLAASTARADEAARQGCKLFSPESATTPTGECVRCHNNYQSHPVDLDYAAAAARQPYGLRPLREAVRRGIFLPGGQVACVTCHDARSPWKDHIALPPGAKPLPAVDPRDVGTYAGPRAQRAGGAPLTHGAAVTPTPLCMACHAYD